MPASTTARASTSACPPRSTKCSSRSAEPLAKQRHPDRDQGRAAALVALASARAGQRLVHVLGGDHAESAGHAGVELDALRAGGDLVADVVVVAGLPADDNTEAGDPREA